MTDKRPKAALEHELRVLQALRLASKLLAEHDMAWPARRRAILQRLVDTLEKRCGTDVLEEIALLIDERLTWRAEP